MARSEVNIDSDVYGSRLRQKRAARKSRQKHLTRKMSDGPAGLSSDPKFYMLVDIKMKQAHALVSVV